MNYKGFIATDLSELQFRSVNKVEGYWVFKQYDKHKYPSNFKKIKSFMFSDLKLILEITWESPVWVEKKLKLEDFTIDQVLSSLEPYGYTMKRKNSIVYSTPEDYKDCKHINLIENDVIFYQPVDSEDNPLSEEIVLECIFEQLFN